MKPEKAIATLRMNEQARWRSGVTVEEEKEALDMVIEALKEQRPHGDWKITFNGCECSVCKDTTLTIPMNFCPNCGADMRKEGNDE